MSSVPVKAEPSVLVLPERLCSAASGPRVLLVTARSVKLATSLPAASLSVLSLPETGTV